MLNKYLIALIFILCPFAHGEQKKSFDISSGPRVDLIEETNALKLQEEDSIQKKRRPNTFFISAFLGLRKTNQILTNSKTPVRYNFVAPLTFFTAQLNYYPLRYFGKWGVASSIGYSYTELKSETAVTALHMLPLQFDLAYRGELKETQKIIPYAMLGYEGFFYFQRGADSYNTSRMLPLTVATLGMAFNLNRLNLISSQNQTEIVFQYQKNISSTSNGYDLNGDSYQVGGTLNL